MNFTALVNRFARICRSFPGSVRIISAGSTESARIVNPRARPDGRTNATASSTSAFDDDRLELHRLAPRFDPREEQNLIDQRKQMVRADLDAIQLLPL